MIGVHCSPLGLKQELVGITGVNAEVGLGPRDQVSVSGRRLGCEELPGSGLLDVRVDREGSELVEGEEGYTVGDFRAYASALHKLAFRCNVGRVGLGESLKVKLAHADTLSGLNDLGVAVEAQAHGPQRFGVGLEHRLGGGEGVANVAIQFQTFPKLLCNAFYYIPNTRHVVVGGADVGDGAFPGVGLAEDAQMRMGFGEGGDIGVEGGQGGIDDVQILVEAEVGVEEGVEVGMGMVFEGVDVLTEVYEITFEHPGMPAVAKGLPAKVLRPV